MNRLILLLCSILVTGSIVNCGGGGSSDSAGGGGGDTAPLKYIEYMYSNENGAALNNRAAANAVYLQHGEAVRQRMNLYMNMPLLKGAGAEGDPESPNWWQRYNVNAEDYAEYLLSDSGQQAIESFLNDESEQPSGSIYSMSKSEAGSGALTIGTIGSAASAIALPFSIFHTIDSAIYNRKIDNSLKKILQRLQNIENQLYDIQDQLTVIEGQLNNITDLLVQVQVQNASENLNNAKSRVNGFLAEIATLDGVDDTYRADMIKNFILNGYESMVISAYESALERTSVMNQSLAANKIPFSMLFADMVFMVEMSQLRLALAANVFSGQNLLEYRASVARNDLARVREIRNSFNTAYCATVNTDYLIEVTSLINSWEVVLLAHIEAVYGPDDATVIQLEAASNESNGFSTIGDIDGSGKDSLKMGRVLRKKDSTFILDLATYADGKSLADVFDSGVSGAFAEGKYMRIVENGKNITDPVGLNLTPIAKNFTGGIATPPRNQCYIDPVSGQFVLPRPVYWSKCMDMDNLTKTPEIYSKYYPTSNSSGSIVDESFIGDGPYSNKVLYRYNRAYSQSQAAPQTLDNTRIIYPSGEHAMDWSRGVVSLWIRSNGTIEGNVSVPATGTVQSDVLIGEENKIAVRSYDYYMRNGNGESSACQYILYLGGSSIGYVNVARNVWHHVYMVWDSGGGLGGGTKTIRLYVDGVEQISSTASIPDLTSWVLGMTMRSYAYALGFHIMGPYYIVDAKVYSYIENIKIWDHVVSEDPSWLYNGGTGRENALHVIYGPDNNYAPKLTGPGNGVGYYYVP